MKKMNKKIMKILTALVMILMLVNCCNAVFAESYHVPPISPNNNTPFGVVITVVQYGCYAAALIWIMIVGVKYMTSAPEGKAEMKKQALAALIGGMILFGAGTIVKWVSQVVPN